MAVTYVQSSAAVVAGTTTATPTLPTTPTAGDRVYITAVTSPAPTSTNTPAGWTKIVDASLGTTVAPAAGAGQRIGQGK